MKEHKNKIQNKSLTKRQIQKLHQKRPKKHITRIRFDDVSNNKSEEIKFLDKIHQKLKEFPLEFHDLLYLIDRGGEKIGRRNLSHNPKTKSMF